MGFFAGFGESFSRSFENQRQRSAEREDDLFRMKFQEFARRREKEDTLRLQDSKDVEKAKSFIMGTPGIPPEALGIVYNWVKSGMDDSWIVDQLKADKFSVKNTDAQADIQSPSDEQMGDMGMGQSETAPASPEASAAPQQASFDGGGFLSQIFPGMKKFERPSRNARVDQRMSEVTGMTPEEMNKPYESPSFDTSGVEFTPGATADAPSNLIEAQQQLDAAMANLKANPNDPAALEAVAKATQMYQSTLAGASTQGRIDAIAQNPGSLGTQEVVVTDPQTGKKSVVMGQMMPDGSFRDEQGQPLEMARTRTPQEVEMATTIQKNLGERTQKQNDSVSNLAQAYVAFGNARAIIAENPAVLQERTSGITRYLVDLGKDVVAGVELASAVLNGEQEASPEQLQKVEGKLKAAMGDPQLGEAQKLAAAKALINVQYAIAAYHVAAAKGQEGRNLSEAERAMFKGLPEEATSPEQWDQLVGSLLVPTKQALDKQSQLVPQSDPMNKWFMEHFGYSPVGDMPTVEQYLEGTPGADLDRVLPQSGFKVVTSPSDSNSNPEGKPPDQPKLLGTKTDKDGVAWEIYQKPDGTKFKKRKQ